MQTTPHCEAMRDRPPGDQGATRSGVASRPLFAGPPRLGLSALEPSKRRLPERILVAAHQACDMGALDVAASLLQTLEATLSQRMGGSLTAHRRVVEGLVAAYERLWHLRHAQDPMAPASASLVPPVT